MNQIRVPLAEWATNSKHLKDAWRTDGVDFKEVTRTLAIDWDIESDTFSMDSLSSPLNTSKAPPL